DLSIERGDAFADHAVLLRLRRQQPQRRHPAIARDGEVTVSSGRLGLRCERLERVGVNERRAGRAGERTRRELGPATRAGCGCHAGVGAGVAPTRYGPSVRSVGAAVIRHACRMPMKMMNALMSPAGNDPATISTGSAMMKPAESTSAIATLSAVSEGARR